MVGDKEDAFKFMNRFKIESIDCLHTRYQFGYYNKLDSLQSDFAELIDRVIERRCKNNLAKDYLEYVKQ